MERSSPVSEDSPVSRAYLARRVQEGAQGPNGTSVGREFRPFRRSVLRSPPDDAAPALLHAYLAASERPVSSEVAYLASSPAVSVLRDSTPPRSLLSGVTSPQPHSVLRCATSPPPHSVLHRDLSPTTHCVLHSVTHTPLDLQEYHLRAVVKQN